MVFCCFGVSAVLGLAAAESNDVVAGVEALVGIPLAEKADD